MTDEHVIEFVVETAGERLDRLVQDGLSPQVEYSRTQVQALIKDGHVTVDGQAVKAGVKLRGGERIRITLPPPPEEETVIMPEEMALNVLYEDEDIAVIDKPAGLVVHPGVGNPQHTLVNALLARYPRMIDMQDDPDAEGRMGIVHRLDKDTSGLMVVAMHSGALRPLMAQFQARSVDKFYLALLERTPGTATGVVDAPIARDPKQRKRMAVVREGRPAVTEFEVIDDQFRDGQALVRLKLLTGRTHQIRVHMAFIGCPVVGDQVYGFRKQRLRLKRHFLHAAELAFDHPTRGERLRFTADLPLGLRNILEKLR